MAKLSASEQETLKKLREKEEAPDRPAVGKSISANIDLSDPKQVALAIKHGFLDEDEVEELKENKDGKDSKEHGTPRRRGYFKDKEGEEE